MKKASILLATITLMGFMGQAQSKLSKNDCPSGIDCTKGNVLILAPETAGIYVDGIYTGKQTPAMLDLSTGAYVIGVTLEEQEIYLRKELEVSAKAIKVEFSKKYQPDPMTWKALFIGVPAVYGESEKGKCSTHFTTHDLDDAYSFFKWNLSDHIEPFSYNTIKWEVDRHDLTEPVELTKTENGWYTLEAEQGLEQITELEPGKYDVVFLFWNEEEGDCSFSSSYFGLAWLDPTEDRTKHTGYITVKFNAGEMGVAAKLEEYKNNDPGVWTHEWLHVVIEQFFPNRGVKVPTPAEGGDGLILHAAGVYNYTYPWMDWYKDLISGRVKDGDEYVGIGPEEFLKCSITTTAKQACKE